MQIVRIALTKKYDSPIVYAIEEEERFIVIEDPFDEKNGGKIKRTNEVLSKTGRVVLAPCCPTKIIGIAVNYESFVEEKRVDRPQYPELYLLPSTCIIGKSESISYPRKSQRVCFEVEVAVVIGARAKNVTEDEADGFIIGYSAINNATAKDILVRGGNLTHAQGFDSTLVCGPCIETYFDIKNKELKASASGKNIRIGNTNDLIFSPRFLVSYVSKIMTLLPGDLILTGAPFEGRELKSGEVVEIEVEGIGKMSNLIV